MSRITQKAAVAPLGLYTQATSLATGTGIVDQSFVTYTGQRFDLSDGREVVLVGVGATSIVSGVLCQAPAIIAGHQTLAMTVSAATPATAGTNQILVTNGATVVNANYYAGGFLIVKDGTGAGQTLKIQNNQPAAASATFIVTTEDAIVTTLDATSVINLIANPYGASIIAPTTATANVIGVTFYPLTGATLPTFNGTSGIQATVGIQQYGFIATKGIVSCLSDASVATVGLGIMRSTTTAGTITVRTATGSDVGSALQTTISAKYGAVTIDL